MTIDNPLLRRFEGGARKAFQAGQQAPLVSIIVVVFKDRNEVAALMDNISPFRSSDLELVIIDGGSNDGTLELLQANNQRVDYWLSEPDSGIYDAMNKGIAAAQGKYVLHINAGDRLRAIPWEALRKYAETKVDVVCCRVLIDGKVEFVSRTSFLSKIDNTWHHQGTFYRRAAHLGYDTTYRTHGDFDHNQRMLRAGRAVKDDPCTVADHQSGGVSMADTGHREIFRSVTANFGRYYLMLSWLRFKLMDIRAWVRNR